MEMKDKPRLAEILGVEVRQKFAIDGFDIIGECWIDEDGFIINNGNGLVPAAVLARIINTPELINRAVNLTPAELAICRALGARWVSRDNSDCTDEWVDVWSARPERKGTVWDAGHEDHLAAVKVGLFPSLRPGDLAEVPEEREAKT